MQKSYFFQRGEFHGRRIDFLFFIFGAFDKKLQRFPSNWL